MHIGIFFYADTVVMATGQKASIMGRAVANNDFMRALLKHAAGHKITLFVTTQAEAEFMHSHFAQMGLPCEVIPYLRLREYLSRHNLDILHVPGPEMNLALAVRSRYPGQRFAVTGLTHTLSHDPHLSWLLLNLMWQPRTSDALVCTTPTAREVIHAMTARLSGRLTGAPELATEIIPLGIFAEEFRKSAPSLQAKLGFPPEAVTFLYLGRISYKTKTDLVPLVIAFDQARKASAKEMRLVIAGATGGEDYANHLIQHIAKEGLKDVIRVVANPDDAVKMALFKTAQVFVSPCDNAQETFGLSLIEAQAAGLPVIASDWDGYRSLIREGDTGFLIPTLTLSHCDFLSETVAVQLPKLSQVYFAQSVATDVEMLAEKMRLLSEDESLRKAMAARAAEHGATFDWRGVIERYLSLWQKLSQAAQQEDPVAEKEFPGLDYHDVFRSYATRTLGDEDQIIITERGRQALIGKATAESYPVLQDILDYSCLTLLLKKSGSLHTVANLVRHVAPKFSADVARYHLVWLVKQGLLRYQSS